MSTVIGLAFGNTSSSIGFVNKEGKVDIIANQDGDRAIPSAISYIHGDEYHGLQAKNQLIRNPRNTVAYFRDFIGQSFSDIDPTYTHASAHPVEKDGRATFELKTQGDDAEAESVTIEHIAARHLTRLRESAVDFLGKPVDGAVIAVPTDFGDDRRSALTKVAQDAGIKVLQLVNEPTAALLAHVSAQQQASGNPVEDKIYVVADFGGTRSDGAVIASRGGIFTILATQHDFELGGYKLDEALSEFVAKNFEKEHGVDPMKETRAIAKLMAESEVARKTLSNTTSSNFAIESLASGIDYRTTINRLRFELAARPVFNRFVSFVENLVKKAELDVLDVDEVLLVGGVSFTPKIASSLSAVFDEKTVVTAPTTDTKAVNPNELVARGAAIQASLIANYDDEEIAESLQAVVTVAPHLQAPIGIKVNEDSFVTVIDIDTALPIRKTHVFDTDSDNVLVGVYEGQSEIVTKTLEKPAKEEKEQDDDESDWSDDDDEPEEVREKVVKPGKLLAEAGLKGITKGSKVEVVLSVTKELKIQVAAREVKNGGVAVRGVTAAASV